MSVITSVAPNRGALTRLLESRPAKSAGSSWTDDPRELPSRPASGWQTQVERAVAAETSAGRCRVYLLPAKKRLNACWNAG